MDWLSLALLGLAVAAPEPSSPIRAILGFILVFFLPGFAWTFVFFRGINVVERVTLSLALSIALVTLSLLSLNRLVGLRITLFNSILVIVLITVLPLAAYYLNRLIKKRARNLSSLPPKSRRDDGQT